jgi:hypothetical protein
MCYSHTYGAGCCAKSPIEINQEQEKDALAKRHEAHKNSNDGGSQAGRIKEHDTVVSKTTGRTKEIDLGPNDSRQVPANPFASIQQARFLHAHPEKVGGKAKLAEWDKSTDFSRIPRRVKK